MTVASRLAFCFSVASWKCTITSSPKRPLISSRDKPLVWGKLLVSFAFALLHSACSTHLRQPEVDDHNVHKRQAYKDQIVLPLDVGESRGTGFNVHQCRQEGSDYGPGHALGPDVGGEDLTAVDIRHDVNSAPVEGDEAESEENAEGIASFVTGAGKSSHHCRF